MRGRLKGFMFLVLGVILIFISLIMWTGVIPWILGLIGVYLAIWKGLVRIARGEEKSIRLPELVRDKLIETRACPSCGNVHRLESRFCSKCGSPLPTVPTPPSNAQFCHNCGRQMVDSSVVYCPDCGVKITE